MDKKVLNRLQLGIKECRRVLKDYRKSESPSSVLVGRLVDLEKTLLDDFFRAATDKPAKKPAKKPGRSEKTVVSDKPDKSDGKLAGTDSSKADPLKMTG